MSLDPRLLETFRAVAHTGKISAAARRLHLSQPAVTAQVKRLEESAGGPLLLRTPRGVTLNLAGEKLLRHAERLTALLQEAEEELVAPPESDEPLVIGASTTVAGYLLPALVGSFVRAEGRGGVRVEVGNTGEVLDWVERARVPLGLVEGPPRAGRVRIEPFVPDALLPVVAADAPPRLARLRSARELADVPLLWREPGSGTRAVVERALRRALGKARRHQRDDLQFGSTEALRRAALLGLGVAFLSRLAIGAELDAGTLVPLPLRDLVVRRDLSWALPAGEIRGRAGRFWRHARARLPRPSGPARL
ncbi:MAG: LysR family transcriptional regulator [Deltaproteobacteria bacterium]